MRARELGLPLPGCTGQHNAITDVPGVAVGYTTLIEGDAVRTGVTAILPRPDVEVSCAAGWFSLNGNGEMTGTTWLTESGRTAAAGADHEHARDRAGTPGVIDWVNREKPSVAREWLLPVVAETWDGYLNDINAPTVQPSHAVAAIDAARPGPVTEARSAVGPG